MLLVLVVAGWPPLWGGARAEEGDLQGKISALSATGTELRAHARALLDQISRQRYEEFENARGEVRGKLEQWMSGDVDLKGQQVQRMLAEAYRIAEGYGLDTGRIKRIHGVARRAILRADFFSPGETGIGTLKEFTDKVKDAPVIGNVVHFYGLVDKEEERIASSMKKRLVQYKNLLQVLIKVLTIADPAQALKQMHSYTELALAHVTDQERGAIDADTKQMLANQNGVVEFAGALPLVGEAMDAVALYYGEDLAGNKIDRLEFIGTQVAFMGLFKLAGATLKASGGMILEGASRIKNSGPSLAALSDMIGRLSPSAKARLDARLAKEFGGTLPEGSALSHLVAKFEDSLTQEMKRKGRIFGMRRDAAKARLDGMPSAAHRDAAFEAGRAGGKKSVDDFDNIMKGKDPTDPSLREAALSVQGDKHAMQQLNGLGQSSPETIEKFNKVMGGIYKEADEMTRDRLADKYFDDFLAAKGISPSGKSPAELNALKDELRGKIKIDLITNKTKPGDPPKAGMDRDVTATIEMPPGKVAEIPPDTLEDAYAPSFYEAAKGKKPPKPENGVDPAKDLLEEMDQVKVLD